MCMQNQSDNIHGYEVKRSVIFENNRGFALAEDPEAVNPFVTWQFTEENGERDYYWGHYINSKDAATRDYEFRVSEYKHEYGLSERDVYKYYSTQRPVDIGTFPKTDNGPLYHINYDEREYCENDTFKAWGYLVYDAPLTEKQIDAYELRAASDNPDRDKTSPQQLEEQIQAIGKYEDSKRMNRYKRLTWLHSDFGVYYKYEDVAPARIAERFAEITAIKARAAERLAANRKPGVKFYDVDPELARRAREANSVSGYVASSPGLYRARVKQAYEQAERQKQLVDPAHHADIDSLVDTFARKLADNFNERNTIHASQPPAPQTAHDKNTGEYLAINGMLNRINDIGRARSPEKTAPDRGGR